MAEFRPGWRQVRFGELAECVNERVDDPSQAGVDRYVGLEHLDSESLAIRRWGTPEQVESTKLRFRPGDIIFGKRRAYQRKLAVADFEGICSAHAMVLRARPGAVLPEFLPFLMQSDMFMERAKAISVGSLSPTINWKTLAAEEFVLPPLDEQHRLVAVLRHHREIAEAIVEALHQAETVRRSILLQWFRWQRGAHDSFPTHWHVRTVGEVGAIQVGIRKHPGSLAGPNMRPYLRVANVLDGEIDWSDIARINVPSSDQERCALLDGDILINKGNSINLVGRPAIYRQAGAEQMYFQDHLLRFRASRVIAVEFAQAYFQHLLYTLQFTRIAVASTSIATIPMELFEALPFPVPPLDDQMVLVEQIAAHEIAIRRLRERARLAERLGAKLSRHMEEAV